MDSELDRRPTHSCTGTIEAAGSEVREVGMNLARGRELGISSRVDEGHDWIHKPSRSFYEGKASVGEATGGSSGDIAVVLGATNGEDEDNDSRDERAETHVAASSSPAPDVASVVSSSAARLHAFNAPLGRRARVDVANWMAQLVTHIADTPLHRLRLPGTHDSGAYHLSRTRMGDLPARSHAGHRHQAHHPNHRRVGRSTETRRLQSTKTRSSIPGPTGSSRTRRVLHRTRHGGRELRGRLDPGGVLLN